MLSSAQEREGRFLGEVGSYQNAFSRQEGNMEIFQNLFLLCLGAALLWLHIRVKKVEERTNKTIESSGNAAMPPQEAKEIARSAGAGGGR
jgi:hypothetical protein